MNVGELEDDYRRRLIRRNLSNARTRGRLSRRRRLIEVNNRSGRTDGVHRITDSLGCGASTEGQSSLACFQLVPVRIARWISQPICF